MFYCIQLYLHNFLYVTAKGYNFIMQQVRTLSQVFSKNFTYILRTPFFQNSFKWPTSTLSLRNDTLN